MKGDSLRFIHFSGYGDVLNNCIKKWLPEGEHPFKELHAAYSKHHDENNADGISNEVWSYAVYASGEKIDNALRVKYRSNYDVMFSTEDPFALSNGEMERLLESKRIEGKLSRYARKCIEVYRKEGLRKVISKIRSRVMG